MFKNKSILVTGHTGLIGQSLVKLLKQENPKLIRGVSLDNIVIDGVESIKGDLTRINICEEVCKDIDYVFSLVGTKSNPSICKTKPYSFIAPMVMFNTNIIHTALKMGVEHFLYTSSIGVYAQAEIFKEDDVWKTLPSENDFYAGLAKRVGEACCQAYNIEYQTNKTSIVRPCNTYGPWDNFNPKSGMIIPSLIYRICSGENPLVIWGDGSAIRDIAYCDDIATGMIHVVKNKITEPVNLGTGVGVSVRDIVECVTLAYRKVMGPKVEIEWDLSKPTGDKKRLMDVSRMKNYGFECKTKLSKGILNTLTWYLSNQDIMEKRYDVFQK